MTYTPDQIAQVCHEANRALQAVNNDEANPAGVPWRIASQEQRQSAIDGVHAALAGKTPEELHDAWCEFKLRHGWRHGDVKDEQAKTHPCLVPYGLLPETERVKDHLFAAIVDALTSRPGIEHAEQWQTTVAKLVHVATVQPAAGVPVTACGLTSSEAGPDVQFGVALPDITCPACRVACGAPPPLTVGDIVHYVSYGTPGGEYARECRAAVVTDTSGRQDRLLALAVLNPTGMFFNPAVLADPGRDLTAIGQPPTTMCAGLDFTGGTWHRPART